MIQVRDSAGHDRLWPLPSSTPTLRALEQAYRAALTSGRRVSDFKSGLAATSRYTEQGLAAEGHKYAREQILPEILRGHVALQRARRNIQDRMREIRPRPVDKTDLVSAFRRAEIRDAIRAMPREQRDNLLSRYASELDPDVVAAILEHTELPWTQPEARLISDDTRKTLLRQAMASEHGEALQAVQQIEEAIKLTAPVVEKASAEIQSGLGMNALEFEKAMQAEAAKRPPVWLRQMGSEIRVIVPGGSARLATEEEKAVGVYFSNIDEFNAAMAAA